MPFKSEKQRRYLWANEPEVARKFADEAKRKALADAAKRRIAKKRAGGQDA